MLTSEPSHHEAAVRFQVAHQYPIQEIGRADGLPSGQVHRTSPDAKGRSWMATPNGLVCADGSRVVSYGRRDGLSTHGLRCVAAAQDGSVWVGSDVGVDRVDPDGVIEAMVAGWRWGLANDIAAAGDGTVWVASANGLVRWDAAAGWQPDERFDGAPVHQVTVDRTGRVLVASRHLGVFVRTRSGWRSPGDAWRAVGVAVCVGSGDGSNLVIGGSEGAVEIDAVGAVGRRIDPVGAAVHAVHATRHELWLGTASGLRCYTAGDDSWVLSATLLGSERINDVTADHYGNIWVATDSCGVAKVEAVRHAIERPDLDNGAVFAIRSNDDGDYVIAGDRGCGVYRPGRPASWFPFADLSSQKVWDVAETRQGTRWAATETGLVRVTHADAERVGVEDPVLAAPGRALLPRGDALWVGTLNGLAKLAEDGSFETVRDRRGESLGYVYTLVEDGDSVWIGTLGNGLWRHRRSGIERVVGDGLTDTGNTYAIAVREHGSLAVLQDDRIVMIDGDTAPAHVTTADEALVGWAAAFDRAGSLWVGSSTGLCQYDVGTGELRRRVTLWMGVDGWEFTTSRALTIDHAGRLLCGLNSGLAIVDPSGLDDLGQHVPRVELASLNWSNVVPTSDGATNWAVAAGPWTVEAHFYSTWPFREATRLFRHRLVGFDPTWSHPSPLPVIQFSSLPPGAYALEVQAHSALVGWGPSSMVAAIEVTSNRSIGSIFRGSRAARTLRRLARENQVLEQRVHSRTRELTEARDQLTVANRELAHLSLTDPLTLVANRRRFDTALSDALRRSRRTDTALSLLLIDVDSFKAYNDQFGHIAGDRCLRDVAAAMAEVVRVDVDLLARYGGEEFAVLLPDTDADTAMVVAERLRLAISDLAITHPRSPTAGVVTASIGVATTISGGDTTAADLIGIADRGLYAAKHAGRNCCLSGDNL